MKKEKNKLMFLGPSGSFSELAALSFHKSNKSLELTATPSLEKLAKDLNGSKKEHFGIMAYYNILEGLVQETLDLIYEYKLTIIDVIKVPIVFNSVKYKGSGDAENVYAHPKGLAQTSDWINKNYPDSVTTPTSSNSEAVMKILAEKKGIAIAGPQACKNANLKILGKDIGNKKNDTQNYTSFYVVAKNCPKTPPKRKKCLTMIAVTPHIDKPGLLAEILTQISYYNLNNYKLHSRPAIDDVKLKNYDPQMFYIEVECTQEDERFKRCLEAINYKLKFKNKQIIRVLGTYNFN